MSAFIVDRTHIDALVIAGLELRKQGRAGWDSPLRWFEREISEEEERETHERGEPWGPRAIELAQELRRELTEETAGRVGQMLWAENARSVNHRYDEEEWEEVYEYNPARVRFPGRIDPLKVLSALSCYEYQTCEHPEWERSEAHAFVESLKAACVRALPGYEDGPWEVQDLSEILTA